MPEQAAAMQPSKPNDAKAVTRLVIDVRSEHPETIELARRAAQTLAEQLDYEAAHRSTVELRDETDASTRVERWDLEPAADRGNG